MIANDVFYIEESVEQLVGRWKSRWWTSLRSIKIPVEVDKELWREIFDMEIREGPFEDITSRRSMRRDQFVYITQEEDIAQRHLLILVC